MKRAHRHQPTAARWMAAAGVASLLGVAAVISVNAATPTPLTMATVDAVDLRSQGFELSSPNVLDVPAIDGAAAASRARGFRGGLTVREVRLARVHYQANSKYDCLCWAVSVQPRNDIDYLASRQGTSASAPIAHVKYMLLFYDARTARLVSGVERMAG